MIKAGKKRAAEKPTSSDDHEPSKKRAPKSDSKPKVDKFSKSTKKPVGGAPKAKFAPKDGGAPKGKFTPRVDGAPKAKFAPKDGGAPKGKFSPKADGAPKGKFTPKVGGAPKGKFTPKVGGAPKGKFSPKADGAPRGKFTPKDGGKPGAAKFVNKFKGKPGTVPAADEKTDWRQFKQDKKDLKLKRKQTKDSYDISIEAKKIYEKLKCRRTEKRSELVEKLYDLLSGGDTIKKLVMAHDTARIIQCMLKFATPALRDQLSEKLLPLVVEMATSKYSHFCVLRMFKYGSPAIKSKLVDTFLGHVVRLACHNISSKILDHVYLTVANAKQKIYMRQEFYGELYKKSKDEQVKQLADTYRETTNMKASILGSVKSNLEHVANKELVDNSLVHAVMLEYLRECDEEKIEETVSAFAALIPLMLTTKDGCQAAIICFYKATPKNRRAIIKTIKEHLIKICTHEHGHIFLLAVLNSLDDTKATKKAIYDNIHPELETLMANQWGRRVVEWLISPADTNCFHPTFIATLDEGLQYGKKDKDVRRKEIFEQIEEPISTAIAEKPEFWISDKHLGLVTAEILKKISTENFVKAATALATIIVNPGWKVVEEEESSKDKKTKKPQDVEKIIADATKLKKQKQKQASKVESDDSEEEDNEADDNVVKTKSAVEEAPRATVAGIEEAGLHVVLKKIIKGDKERLSQSADSETFGSILVQQLTEDTLKYWFTVNRACFVLLNIVENNNEQTTQTLKQLTKPQLATLKQQSASGAKLLLKKLAL